MHFFSGGGPTTTWALKPLDFTALAIYRHKVKKLKLL